MVTLIYYYVKKIIFFLIFSSFIQILFLNNKFKNYLQLVLNLILIFIMLDPIFDIFNYIKKGDLDDFIQISEDFNFSEEYYTNIENTMFLNLLTQNIKSQTQSIIGDDYSILDFELTLVEDYNYQPIIKHMYISLSKSNNLSSSIYVRPFNSYDENQNLGIYEQDINNIKTLISNFYNLSPDNIFITIV